MNAAVLYARYSTTMQSQASVEDQFRLLRQRAERETWSIAGEHADRAISGTVRDRPGLALAMLAIEQGAAQVLFAESLDRLSRDQEDLANIFKRVRFAGGRIITLSEGEIGALHIGMGGTMSAIFLEQLADKVRRGHVGRVEAGRIPGGISYGYNRVRQVDARGEPERGLREIDPAQAEVVRRIFADYADGVSPVAIAKRLNDEGIPSPRGKLWRANAITGHRKRRNGIIHNELYRGRILYNRQSFRKDPTTRKRVSRPNAEVEFVSHDVPELRIVDEDLWQRAHARIARCGGGPAHKARRPRRLLSGLLRCSRCQGAYTIVTQDRWGCSKHKQTGTCDNAVTITNAVAERRILTALEHELLHPDVIAAHLDELRLAAVEARRDWIARRADREHRIAKLQAEQSLIADKVLKGFPEETFMARAHAIVEELRAIEGETNEIPDLEAILAHPAATEHYRRAIANLHAALRDDRTIIADLRRILEPMVDHVEIAPRADGRRGADMIVHGDLAAILELGTKKPARAEALTGDCTVSVVAGVGFEPTTFRL